MSNYFSREARSEKYRILRQLMISTNGTILFEDCALKCKEAGIEIQKSEWSAAKHQYKEAIKAGHKPETPAPVPTPAPAPVESFDDDDTGDDTGSPIAEELESMTDFDDDYDDYLEETIVPVTPVTPKEKEVVTMEKALWEVPAVDPHYSFNPKLKDYLNGIEKLSKADAAAGKPSAKIRLTGAAGCGKTSMAVQFAAKTKRPVVIIDCPTLREAKDLFGFKTADEKGIRWVYSLFVKAIKTPRMVVVLDEINRLSPMALNTLLPMADHRGQTFLDDSGEIIKVAGGVTMFATMNEGSQFTGTDQMDGAIADRFPDIIEVDYLDEAEESALLQRKHGLDAPRANKLALIAKTVRQKFKACEVYTRSLSTRLLENAASKLVVVGNSSLEFTIVNHFPDDGSKDSERAKIRELIKGAGLV